MLRKDIVTKDTKKIQFEYYLLITDKIISCLIRDYWHKMRYLDMDLKKN